MDDHFQPYRDALQRGHASVVRGRLADALKHYEDAARLAEQRALPHMSIGDVLSRMGRHGEAVDAYRRAVERSPGDAEVVDRLADALVAAGRRDEAARVRQNAAAPTAGRAPHSLSRQETASLPPAELMHLAGHRARLEGRTQTAVEAWLNEARSHAAAGRLDAALDACQHALLVSSGAPRVHLQMARLYFQRGWRELAVERLLLLDRLLALGPDPDIGAGLEHLVLEHRREDQRLADLAADISTRDLPAGEGRRG